MEPRLSVIIPVYNSEAYLEKCLDSVCLQTLGDIEIICVDDCSSDGSGRILDDYVQKYDSVRVFHNTTNLGADGARNLGIENARGEYIGFADSDDWVDSDFYRSLYECAVAKCADIVLNVSILKELPDRSEPYQWLTYNHYPAEGEYLTPSFSANNTHCFIYLHLYRRALLMDNHIRFSIGRNVHDDDFFHRVSSMSAKTIFAYAGPYYHYRYRTGSLMQSRILKNKLYQEMFRGLKEYYGAELSKPDFELKLYNRMLFSDITEVEYQGVKDYLSSLSGYLENSGVWPSDFDKYAIGHILQSASHKDLMKRIGLDPWVRYHSLERLKNRMKTKVSVIIPIYNTADYLDRCIRSVCDQTLHDIEIICVNDCSTDNSLNIIKQYALEDNRIRIIDLPENGGVSNARNTAMNAARGKYVFFMDSDDWIDSGYLEKMLSVIDAQNTDIVINCSFINEYDDTAKNTAASYPFINPEGEFLPAGKLQIHYPPVIWSRLYRKSFLDANKITFPIVKGGAEDIFFAYASDLTLGVVFAFRGDAYHYYQRPASAMHTSSRGFHYFESFSLLNNYLESRGVSTNGIKLFYVESLILDTEQKYAFVKSYLESIKNQIRTNAALYNEQELFLLRILEETPDYEQFLQKYNPNISLSYIRCKMIGRK